MRAFGRRLGYDPFQYGMTDFIEPKYPDDALDFNANLTLEQAGLTGGGVDVTVGDVVINGRTPTGRPIDTKMVIGGLLVLGVAWWALS